MLGGRLRPRRHREMQRPKRPEERRRQRRLGERPRRKKLLGKRLRKQKGRGISGSVEAAGAARAAQSCCAYSPGGGCSEGIRSRQGSNAKWDCGVREGEGTGEVCLHKLPEEGH